jgi:ribosomal protein S18 acetylase RimI-like enzyme
VVVPDDAVSGPILTSVLRIERVGFGHPDALLLIEAVQEEYVARYGGRDDTPLDPLMFEPPAGSFYVGYLDDVPVVSGAWRRRGDVEAFGTTVTAEVKRMYVARSARGLGLARAMLAHLERAAAAGGAEAMVLETGTAQPEAIALYESSGYTRIASFGHYAWSPSNRCFAKPLLRPAPKG